MKRLTARDRLDAALAHIDDPSGEGARACLTVYREAARARRRRRRCARPRRYFARARSTAPSSPSRICSTSPAKSRAPAPRCSRRKASRPQADAPVVQRLRAAGAVIVAKTNMTEFAYLRHRRQSALRHAGQSGRPQARARRLVVGRQRRGRRRHVRDRHRQRHRRLGAHSGRALRHRRLQAEPAAHSDRRRLSAVLQHRLRSARSRAPSRIAPRPTR